MAEYRIRLHVQIVAACPRPAVQDTTGEGTTMPASRPRLWQPCAIIAFWDILGSSRSQGWQSGRSMRQATPVKNLFPARLIPGAASWNHLGRILPRWTEETNQPVARRGNQPGGLPVGQPMARQASDDASNPGSGEAFPSKRIGTIVASPVLKAWRAWFRSLVTPTSCAHPGARQAAMVVLVPHRSRRLDFRGFGPGTRGPIFPFPPPHTAPPNSSRASTTAKPAITRARAT
jgi:hypothetical protein